MNKEQAYEKLELPIGTDLQVVRQKFQQMYNNLQMQIDGAFNAELKQRKVQHLAELEEAYAILNESKGMDDSGSLPRTEKTFEQQTIGMVDAGHRNSIQTPEQALELFGLTINSDEHTVSSVIRQHIEELQRQYQTVSIPAAKQLYQQEIEKAEKAAHQIEVYRAKIRRKQEEERLRLENEEKIRIETQRKKEEEERLKAEQEAQRKAEEERRRKLEEQQRKKEEEERLKTEQEAQRKAEEKQQQKAAQTQNVPQADYPEEPSTSMPTAKKRRNIALPLILVLLLVGGGLYYFMRLPTGESPIPARESNAEHMEAIRDSTAWQSATAAHNIAAYQHYLSTYTEGIFRDEAAQAINVLRKESEKKATEEDIRKKQQEAAATKAAQQEAASRQAMQQYNEDVAWARNMIEVDGCAGCKQEPLCRNEVIKRLRSALKHYPNGVEAKELLNCVN